MDLTQLKSLIVALTLLINTLQGYVLHPPVARFSPKETHTVTRGLLGAITTTSGFNYPTATTSFNDGDIINAGDINSIFNFVGIRNSTDTASVSYNAFNPPLGTASGTLGVAKGGTATTTFVQGLATVNGTNAFGSVPTNGAGSIPIASGTQFVANTLTAGANITLNNAAGSITITSLGTSFGFPNHKLVTTLGTTTITAASSTLYVTVVAGGGGGGDSNSGTGKGGSAGGSGAYTYRHVVTGLTVGNSYNVFVGAGGNASAGSGSGNGGNASSSQFDAFILCNGGGGGTNGSGAVGAGGTIGAGCDQAGANGGLGGVGGGSAGGGGGAGAGTITTLEALGNYNVVTGFCTASTTVNSATSTGTSATNNGPTKAGFGDYGCGGQGPTATAVGNPGSGYGSGGSGGSGGNSASGAGAPGFILFEW